MFCEKCGTQLPEDATHCSACGKAFEEASTPEPQFVVDPTSLRQDEALPPRDANQRATPLVSLSGKALLGLAGLVIVCIVVICSILFSGVSTKVNVKEVYTQFSDNASLRERHEDTGELIEVTGYIRIISYESGGGSFSNYMVLLEQANDPYGGYGRAGAQVQCFGLDREDIRHLSVSNKVTITGTYMSNGDGFLALDNCVVKAK